MKTSRIVLPLVLVALFVFLPFSQSFALVDRQDSPVVDCEELIRTVYTKMNGVTDRSADEAYKALRFDKKTKAYLDSKISLTEYNDTLYDLGKDYYAVQVKLLGVNTENGRRTAEYQVIENFKYTNTRERSVKSEVVYITLDAENTICDFYCPTADFDMTVRGNLSLNELSENGIATKANDLKAQIRSVYEAETNSHVIVKSPVDPIAPYKINHSNVSYYAKNNYYKNSPSSGVSGVSYFDFSTISNQFDCTNFVSHAIAYGGAHLYDTGGSGISSTGWYYRDINNRSSSWSSVVYLYNYLVNNTVYNKASGVSSTYSMNGVWEIGDILQLSSTNSANDYIHSTIITGRSYISSGTYDARVTYRTSSSSYGMNVAPSSLYTGVKRNICVYNYFW